MKSKTQVIIIGGGPSGLLLGQLLELSGIDTVILEAKSKEHVIGRIRAGVLESGLVRLLDRVGVSDRLRSECMLHEGTCIADHGDLFRIDVKGAVGSPIYLYGQNQLTRDLYAARDRSSGKTVFDVSKIEISGITATNPSVTYVDQTGKHQIEGDFIIGCDGFHGISRQAIPASVRTESSLIYPFGWIGVLSETPPAHKELVYAASARGFALCSMRNESLSRYYVQCDASDTVDHWSDAAFWDELRRRLPEQIADTIATGPAIEKSIVAVRSFVSEPMQYGNLFLCGDAAHIMPPTGAKGLNTAASDVYYLHQALAQHYLEGDRHALESYSERALARVWQAQRFSRWLTWLLHSSAGKENLEEQERRAELRYLRDSEAAQRVFAENYAGIPYESGATGSLPFL